MSIRSCSSRNIPLQVGSYLEISGRSRFIIFFQTASISCEKLANSSSEKLSSRDNVIILRHGINYTSEEELVNLIDYVKPDVLMINSNLTPRGIYELSEVLSSKQLVIITNNIDPKVDMQNEDSLLIFFVRISESFNYICSFYIIQSEIIVNLFI